MGAVARVEGGADWALASKDMMTLHIILCYAHPIPCTQPRQNDGTALIFAVRGGHAGVGEVLVEAGADKIVMVGCVPVRGGGVGWCGRDWESVSLSSAGHLQTRFHVDPPPLAEW